MSHEIEFNCSGEDTRRCKGKPNTDARNRYGEYFGHIIVNDVIWAVVLWDGDEDPSFYKASCLLIEERAWVSVA